MALSTWLRNDVSRLHHSTAESEGRVLANRFALIGRPVDSVILGARAVRLEPPPCAGAAGSCSLSQLPDDLVACPPQVVNHAGEPLSIQLLCQRQALVDLFLQRLQSARALARRLDGSGIGHRGETALLR